MYKSFGNEGKNKMKLKYKKAVIIVSMGTMLIGLMGFSIGVGVSKPSKPAAVQTSQTPPPPVQTETPEPGYALNESVDEKINDLVQSYFKASVAKDMDALGEIVTNISYVNENQLKVKYEYVEDVQNVECYLIDGPEEGTYLVYVYSELKIKDVDTLAPGLSRFYIITGEDGKLKVFFGADSKIESFIEKADGSEEVKKLVSKVQTRLEEALSSDERLKEFNKRLTEKTDPAKEGEEGEQGQE